MVLTQEQAILLVFLENYSLIKKEKGLSMEFIYVYGKRKEYFHTKSKNPLQSVALKLNRNKDYFEKVDETKYTIKLKEKQLKEICTEYNHICDYCNESVSGNHYKTCKLELSNDEIKLELNKENQIKPKEKKLNSSITPIRIRRNNKTKVVDKMEIEEEEEMEEEEEEYFEEKEKKITTKIKERKKINKPSDISTINRIRTKKLFLEDIGIYLIGNDKLQAMNVEKILIKMKKKSFKFKKEIHEEIEEIEILNQIYETKRKKVIHKKLDILNQIEEYSKEKMIELTEIYYSNDKNNEWIEKYKSKFNEWYFYLQCNFSLLFYGIGSKINILNEFILNTIQFKETKGIIIISGFDIISFKDIFQTIYKIKFNHYTNLSISEILDKLREQEEQEEENIFILIHNIDQLSNSIDYFIDLYSLSFIHLIFSIDFIDSSLMFNSILESKLNILKYKITNYSNYLFEISNSTYLSSNSNMSSMDLKGIKQILLSLPPKEKKLFYLILKNSKTSVSIENLKQFYEENDEILIEKEEIDRMMKNFMDHNLMKEIEKEGKTEYLIQFSKDFLSELIIFLEIDKE
eukprot:gene3464-6113_t